MVFTSQGFLPGGYAGRICGSVSLGAAIDQAIRSVESPSRLNADSADGLRMIASP